MKTKFYLILILILSYSVTMLGAEKKFGKALTLKAKTKISDIMANPEQYNGKRVLVEGAIVGVCEKRGCWIKLASDKEFESITFKVEDGVIVFPMDIKGKTALAEGVVSYKTISVEEQIEQGKKHAKEEGETFDASTISEPKVIIRLMGEGAVVKE